MKLINWEENAITFPFWKKMDALVAYLQMLGTLVDVDSAAAQERLAEEKGR